MPSAQYYREQAILLLTWARETKNRAYAARLRAHARELLAQANLPEDTTGPDLNAAIDEFNDQQFRKL